MLAVASCGAKNNDQPLIPNAPVNLQLNLTDQQYTSLRFPNGAVTLPVKSPAGSGGVKGVIVVRVDAGNYLPSSATAPTSPTMPAPS